MTRSTYAVRGMTCGGCARRVRDAIASLPGVVEVDVLLGEGLVSVVTAADLDDASVADAVGEAGYEVTS